MSSNLPLESYCVFQEEKYHRVHPVKMLNFFLSSFQTLLRGLDKVKHSNLKARSISHDGISLSGERTMKNINVDIVVSLCHIFHEQMSLDKMVIFWTSISLPSIDFCSFLYHTLGTLNNAIPFSNHYLLASRSQILLLGN